MKKSSIVMFVSVIAAIVMSITALTGAFADNGSVISSEEIDSIINTATDPSLVSSPFTQIGAQVCESVVGVRNYQNVTTYSVNDFDFGFGFGFGFGYGNGNGRGNNNRTEEKLAATGSGVVITAYGHVLTNYHVVEDATRITVTVKGDEKEYAATVAGFDADLDIAVLYVPDLQLPAVPMGDSDQLQVGEWAIVVGNPLGEDFARTLTVGVVSALDRNVTDTTYDVYGRRTSVTNKMIQVDAAINSGNSGGGMFNVLGQLMGIPARKYSTSSYSQADVDNIGMCIPINVAKPLIRQVLEGFDPNLRVPSGEKASDEQSASTGKPLLGVTVATVNVNPSLGLPTGAWVMQVNEGSAAEKAGIKPGDIVVEINGNRVENSTALVNIVGELKAGDTANIKLFRVEGMEELINADENTINTEKIMELPEGEYMDLTAILDAQVVLQSSRK